MIPNDAERVVQNFADLCNTTVPPYKVVDKAGEEYLAIEVGRINDVYAKAVARLKMDGERSDSFGSRIFLREIRPATWLLSHETQILQRLISDSLTVGRATLQSDFQEKFIPFLGGEERRIYSETNHVVFGRRGAGKSSLVLYACHQARKARTAILLDSDAAVSSTTGPPSYPTSPFGDCRGSTI